MFKIIGIGLAVSILALLVFASTRPDTFQVRRAVDISARPGKIFPYIEDLHAWREWSPYEKKDPEMNRSFRGPSAGIGAGYAWDGNKEIGAGSMEITESSPPSRLVMKLDFVRPFEAHNIVEFTLEPKDETTQVTSAIQGPMPFVSKVMTVFFNMDKMIGSDFEAGLASLKSIAEK